MFPVYLAVSAFTLTCCNSLTSLDTNNSGTTYTNIDSALKYCTTTKEYKSLLFAFVSKNVENSQKMGWNILGDKDIITEAKKDYVLIILDPSKIILNEKTNAKEFEKIISREPDSPFFVITNQALYPFRQFTLKTNKEIVIDDLRIGEGP